MHMNIPISFHEQQLPKISFNCILKLSVINQGVAKAQKSGRIIPLKIKRINTIGNFNMCCVITQPLITVFFTLFISAWFRYLN